VLDTLRGFDWDAATVGHILRHAVTPYEVGGRGPAARDRRGTTAARRYLVVVFTIRRKQFRTVTAYEMNAAERRTYAPQID